MELFGLTPKMLPERKGNRMSAPVISEKTKLLGWREQHSLKDYIESSFPLEINDIDENNKVL